MTGVTLALLAIVLMAAIVMARRNKYRKIAQQVMLLAMSGVLLTEAYERSGWMRWMNLGVGLFAIAAVVFQAVRDRHTGN